jgi:hypothetical protein
MAVRRLKRNLPGKVSDILNNAEKYHGQFYDVKTFGGPSLHFHRRALGLEGKVSANEQAELIYGVLASWGMHRMGPGGSKMLPFKVFKASLNALASQVSKASGITLLAMTGGDWSRLDSIFKTVQVMKSQTRIVGNSKVMAHLLPNAIAPVDREYTLKYLYGNGTIKNDMDKEWLLLRKIHEEFFYPIAQDVSFQARAAIWMADQVQWPWDTSPLKVIDNLVIGAMKKSKK